jgi:HK97 family phage major capsid protein
MSMKDTLREQRDAKASEAADLLAGEPTEEALATVEARQSEIAALDTQIATVEATEARSAAIIESRTAAGVAPVGRAVITNQPAVYSENGERSFVRDMFNATVRNDRTSWDHLNKHMEESRAASRTDTSSMGELVPPAWLLELTAQYLRPGRVTADLLTGLSLPSGTDSINVPKITTGASVAAQTADNASTSTTDPVTGSVAAPVRTITGYVDAAIQLIEQSPLAGGLDRLIFQDLMADHDYKLDQQVLQGVGTAGQMYGLMATSGILAGTYTSGTPTGTALYVEIVKGISQIAKTRFRPAEGIVMAPSLWYFLASQTDTAGRPLVVPTAGGPMNASGVITAPGGAQGAVGTLMGVPVHLDAAIAAESTQLPILIAKFSDTILFEGGLRTRVLPDVGSATLTMRYQLYSYAAIAARYPSGNFKLAGTGTIPSAGY